MAHPRVGDEQQATTDLTKTSTETRNIRYGTADCEGLVGT